MNLKKKLTTRLIAFLNCFIWVLKNDGFCFYSFMELKIWKVQCCNYELKNVTKIRRIFFIDVSESMR